MKETENMAHFIIVKHFIVGGNDAREVLHQSHI